MLITNPGFSAYGIDSTAASGGAVSGEEGAAGEPPCGDENVDSVESHAARSMAARRASAEEMRRTGNRMMNGLAGWG